MMFAEPRKRFRDILAGSVCVQPASVFDTVSSRIAAALGFEVTVLAGSISSASVLGAPDWVILTLTELADQVRRITRGSDIPLLVDADHGYGNALNAMRTVEELEAAGASGITIEDTFLPSRFGVEDETLISGEEMTGKLRAAVTARSDPSLCVIGRTAALRYGGIAEAEKRLRAYEETGIDAIFLVGARKQAEVVAMHRATRLPLMLYGASAELTDRSFLAAHGVCISLQGHQPFYAAVRAAYETLRYLRGGGHPEGLKGKVADDKLMRSVLRQSEHDARRASYLR